MTKNKLCINSVGGQTSTTRINWADVARGLGMFLVIFGHFKHGGTWSNVNKAIYSFHMPMFFILSGYLAHPRKNSFHIFIARKAYELLIPSFIFTTITLPLYFYLSRESGISATGHLRRIFFVDGKVAYNAPIWFLIVLFQVIFLFEWMRGIQYKAWEKAVAAILLFGCGYLIYSWSVWLPFGIDKTVIGLAFYMTGNLMRDICKMIPQKLLPVIMCASTAAWFLSGVLFNEEVTLYGMELGTYWLFILSGLTGSIMWFGICWVLREIIMFQTWGQNTILIICTHYVGNTLLVAVAKRFGILHTMYFDILVLAASITEMCIYMPISKLFKIYLPFMVGQTMRKKSTDKD